MSKRWLDPRENFDAEIRMQGLDEDELLLFEPDDYADLIPPPGPHDPETTWSKMKGMYKLESTAMDKLMSMIGLKTVKRKAIELCSCVLLEPPKDLDTNTSCNFTFVGNPGSGKTTVAKLLGEAMVDLKYRKNGLIETSAEDILGASDASKFFTKLLDDAKDGTLFIDEAYLFQPAPRGSKQNDSNAVLNMLMKASETMKTTTFILAGYKQEMGDLLGYNDGFASRFPKKFTFEFEDYNENELTKIFHELVCIRNYQLESTASCGVPIAKVLAKRIHRGANKKGFGNGRECAKVLDACRQAQDARLGLLKLQPDCEISDYDYRTLLRIDTIGALPRL